MEALITLYTRATGIEAEKLQMIEDIEAYLTAKEPTAPTYTIQYQKIRLNMSVKVILNESYASPLQANNYTYVKITNKDNLTKPFYFFVKTLNWKSQSCIELDLVLDTLNSFQMGTDYTFSPKTIIQRQHKDRMKHIGEKLIRIIGASPFVALRKYAFNWPLINPLANYTNSEIIFDSADAYAYEYIIATGEIKRLNNGNNLFYTMSQRGTNVIRFSGEHTFDYTMNSSSLLLIASEDPNINEDSGQTALYLSDRRAYVIDRNTNIRNVDLISEELYPQLYGGKITTIQDKGSNKKNWYLVYKTTGSDVVQAFLVPETTTNLNLGNSGLYGYSITPSMLESGKFYRILLKKLDGWSGTYVEYGKENFTYNTGTALPTPQDSGTWGDGCILEFYKQGATTIIMKVWNGGKNTLSTQVAYNTTTAVAQINYTGNLTFLRYGENTSELFHEMVVPDSSINTGYWDLTTQYTSLSPISYLDRTESTLIKVIKMPYCPYGFQLDSSGYITLDSSFTLTSVAGLTNVLQLNKLDLDLKHRIDTDNAIKSPIEEYMRLSSLGSVVQDRNDFFESKMFHSEFYTPKFTYDSFSFIYKFELVNVENWLDTMGYSTHYLTLNFIMTRTINSRFAFEFDDYIVDKREDDYYNWLIIARNNEEVIYNSSYLNYIKTGYNYDVKNKQAQATRNWISVGASVLTAVVGLVGSYATGGASVPLAIMGVSGIISTSANITNTISTQAQNERSIQEKLDTLKLQTASVSGSDDVDLMTRYNGNRLLYITYKVNERIEKLLKDLFYYYGYKDNITGIPNTNTRYWFNHLKCEPILEFTSINMTQEIEDELKGIMRNGFTIYHKRLVNSVATWDIDQVKENWEVSMLPYLS